MKRWYLIRDKAETGPIGRLAEVVELENGMVVVGWLPEHTGKGPRVDTYQNIAAVVARLDPGARLEAVGLRAVR